VTFAPHCIYSVEKYSCWWVLNWRDVKGEAWTGLTYNSEVSVDCNLDLGGKEIEQYTCVTQNRVQQSTTCL
jgi:hypothetical protein